MKWIGQHIVDFIARFRSDVYLENIADGTVASDKFLGLDSNNKIVKEAISSGTTYTAGTGLDLGGTEFSVDVSDFMTNGVDNRVVTATGADALNAESGLTYDSEVLTIGDDDTGTAAIQRKAHSDGDGGDLDIIGGDATSGQTNKTGGDVVLYGGKSTGSADGGSVNINTYQTGTSGTTLASATNTWSFSSGKSSTLSSPIKSLGIKENINFYNETFETVLSDGDHTGSKVLLYGGDALLTDGHIYFLHTDATWVLAQANNVTTGASQLLAVGNGRTISLGVILEGFIRVPHTEIIGTPVIGAPVYISETTAGHFDFDRPTGSNQFVRVVGYCVDTHDDSGVDALIYFKPDHTWVEIA